MFLNASHRIVLFSSKVMSLCNFGPHNATLSSYFAEPLNESSVGMCFKNVPSIQTTKKILLSNLF